MNMTGLQRFDFIFEEGLIYDNKIAVLVCELATKYRGVIEMLGGGDHIILRKIDKYLYEFKDMYELEVSITVRNRGEFERKLRVIEGYISLFAPKVNFKSSKLYISSSELKKVLNDLRKVFCGSYQQFNGLYLAFWDMGNAGDSSVCKRTAIEAIEKIKDLIAIWYLPEKDSESEPENDPKITETNDSENNSPINSDSEITTTEEPKTELQQKTND